MLSDFTKCHWHEYGMSTQTLYFELKELQQNRMQMQLKRQRPKKRPPAILMGWWVSVEILLPIVFVVVVGCFHFKFADGIRMLRCARFINRFIVLLSMFLPHFSFEKEKKIHFYDCIDFELPFFFFSWLLLVLAKIKSGALHPKWGKEQSITFVRAIFEHFKIVNNQKMYGWKAWNGLLMLFYWFDV